jgi:Cu-Zn family superoxide dismutase
MALGASLGLGPVAMATAAAENPTSAQTVVVPIARLSDQGLGSSLGHLTFRSLAGGGLEVIADLRQLPPGPNGFHLHEHPDCGPGRVDGRLVAGGAAGGHWDPMGAAAHHGHGSGQNAAALSAHQGHHNVLPLGDLPPLVATVDGRASAALPLPQFKDLAMIRGRSVLIHAGLHGPRLGCGVIPTQR